ncbi:MAG: ribosome biogenesis GTPase Der [Bacteroidetes bacterium]|jgi:GTPase|nr:ribosome biogenesis GTPase Der [Bacteroidota bacterium]MBT6688044.1 ribosome biogenesis GTPase Der [Bacteroidota bacterium]MBT7145168.1 ribosome biogenesis GTPase Der [Bacteroidota bacterium]MBT7490912.1 ribosome biogenesis GTPase Der [Bacteroidota bacterium]
MGNIVAIVGRPNVGKSTLYNRLTESREAIVDEYSGVTRDRIYGKSDWNGIDFSVIDTGGYLSNPDDIFEKEIRKQVFLAMEEADIILFVVDVLSGITDFDEAVARILQKSEKKIFLVVNKCDNTERLFDSHEFYGLGYEKLYPISSINGSGTGELLDDLVNSFEKTKELDVPDLPKFAIVGRPNVGKSSLLNSLIGKEQNIVTPIAGTTRDSIHTRYQKFGYDFYLIDTAGVRKKGKVTEDLEFYSVMRAVRAIEHADICLLMIDATRGIEAQDVNIFHLIQKNRKGVVVVVNKWDIIEKETNSTKKSIEIIKEKLAPFNDVPIVFASAKTKQRINKILELAIEVNNNRRQRIKTSVLNEFMIEAVEKYPPPSVKGKYIRIKFATQLPTLAPSFAFFCNLPQYVKDPYRRYMENRLREKFNFSGVPIQIFFRKK